MADPTTIIVAASKILVPIIAKILSSKKPHGSKVKEGAFKGSKISLIDNKTCILIDRENIVWLAPEYAESCQFIEKKFLPKKMKEYYYYWVTFKDGSRSYVRVSEKHIDNLNMC